MKGQRDAFDMDMGPMKKGQTIVLKVSEFNTFANVEGYEEPMVVHLQLIASGLGQ